MGKLIATSGGQSEGTPFVQTQEIPAQIKDPLCNKMHDRAFRWILPLMATMFEPSTMRRCFSNRLGHTTTLTTPVSSSMIINITPLALPGFWRTRIKPAAVACRYMPDAECGMQAI
jgi:hypothetical protein